MILKNFSINYKFLTASLIILVVVFLVFLPSLNNEFVNYDDHAYIYENPLIRSLAGDNLKKMFFSVQQNNWIPLTWVSLAIDYQLFGLQPLGYHLINIIIHSFNAVLLFILFVLSVGLYEKKLNKHFNEIAVFFVGILISLLWGLHPLRVEAVAWATERKELLCSLFFLLSIIYYLKFVFPQKNAKFSFFGKFINNKIYSKSTLRTKYYYLCLLFFLLAVLSKPMAVTLPIIYILIDLILLKRTEYYFIQKSTNKTHILWRESFLEKIPFFIISIISGLLTIYAVGQKFTYLSNLSVFSHLQNAAQAIIFYLVKTIIPHNLVPLYPLTASNGLLSFSPNLSLIFFLVITIAIIYFWRSSKADILLFGWLSFLVLIFPVLGFFPVGEQIAADRFTYLTTISFYFVLGGGILNYLLISQNKKLISFSLVAFILILLINYSFLTNKQIKIWKNSKSLWQSIITIYPQKSFQAHNGYGYELYLEGNFAEAKSNFEIALSLDPHNAQILNNLGMLYGNSGDDQQAEYYFLEAYRNDPGNPLIKDNLNILNNKKNKP